MAVAIVLMMWWRLFAPPEHLPAGVMLAGTMYIVVAYSWVDSHIPSYGNPGVGYTVFWRRLLLVLCGFAVAAVVTAFPRPPSGSRQYRRLLSDQISTVNDRYVLLVSTWRSPPDDYVQVTENEALESEKLLHSLIRPISMTKYEFSTLNIDSKTLGKVCDLCNTLNLRITQLLLSIEKLPPPLRIRFMRHTGVTTEGLLGDVTNVLTLVQQSLLTESPLPAVLPTPLITKARKYREPMEGGFAETGSSIRD
ncbi:hypothetical protein BHE90_004838 [Fusarium euwallaceae]|uniref:DUF2421 domain-containing protein n=2 Tax=Fusarium solani species complex TaxID=232080 RepID=A0A430LY53_9HYPO|nr:hypothetical protein CEP51_012869 [Fusarium floridanum]RTE80642.1 hypothetical protein BHE90_004838 [Fusarium euwallaceae]